MVQAGPTLCAALSWIIRAGSHLVWQIKANCSLNVLVIFMKCRASIGIGKLKTLQGLNLKFQAQVHGLLVPGPDYLLVHTP